MKAADWLGALLLAVAPAGPVVAQPAGATAAELSAIDRVWSGHYVPFALAVGERAILVANYDANRQLTVARRPRDGSYWTYHRLDSWTGWDSHNAIAMAVDANGEVHVVANMHNDPLVYFRSTGGDDVRTLERVPAMADPALEQRMTYPVFLHDGEGRLIFKYRDGGSGNGNEIYSRYDPAGRSWHKLLAAPLVDGEGQRNAYFVGPVLGPDGWFHLAWVWRDTPDAATNRDLSYARSRDLQSWERSDGTPLPLPIRLPDAEVVDPVPVRGGMINNNTVPGFDQQGRVLITYHKFDAAGQTQIFVARREADGWRSVQVTRWPDFRWDFGGGGSLASRLTVSGAEPLGEDRLTIRVVRDGAPLLLTLNSATLALIGEAPDRRLADRLASGLAVPQGMQLHTIEDANGFAIAWPTLPPHRDLPLTDIPPPTVLRLVEP
ncbi:BNR repeat-containing protein [Croceibacterium ferulae]|uniref:BNR repeat-containing protein n=1 Tax=Croceibacterium ferulae TaxID=1854641 RepID=UPI000EB3E7F9|nr:BNR repeat-containing protein [Croceibacterium ferulae]